MSLRWISLVIGMGCLGSGGIGLTALGAQQVKEAGFEAVVTASDPAVAVAGAYGGLRLSPRTRLSAVAGLGVAGSVMAWRAEALVSFLLNPLTRRGLGWYLGGGVAAIASSADRGYLIVTAGVEQDPGAGSGWALEAGVGGGVRLSAGYRWRWRNSHQ